MLAHIVNQNGDVHKKTSPWFTSIVTQRSVSNFVVSLPTCYFIMNETQYNYFFERILKAF